MAAEMTADELRTQIQHEDDTVAQINASLQNEKRELSEAKARQALRRELEARAAVTANQRRTLNGFQHFRSSIDADRAGELSGASEFGWQPPKLTRTPRGLRTVRTGYAYQPPACCTYRRRRAAGAPPYVRRALRVPASGVPDVARTVAP